MPNKYLGLSLMLWLSAAAIAQDSPAADAADTPPAEPPAVESQNLTFEKSVFMVEIVQQEWDYKTPWKQGTMGRGVGTAFLIADNKILTNAHNVSNVKYLEIKKQNAAKRYIAKVDFVGHDCDLALLSVEDKTFYDDTIPLRFGSIPQANSSVNTCGFPVGGRQVSITEGVVSRVEVSAYSHTQADVHLVVQTDAAINPGNSGGPVIQNGKVVGVAFQGLQTADNIGYMIPTTVIDHFLTDVSDGTYDGFSSPGFDTFEGLHSPAYTAYLKIPQFVGGIVVTFVQPGSSADGILQAGDVLTQIEGYSIDNDGMIKIYGLTLDWSEALEQKQIGQTYNIAFYHDGKIQNASIKAAENRPILPWSQEFDKQPQYVVYAGLTFVPITRNYLETFGRNWLTELPFGLRYLFFDSQKLNDDKDRTEYVVLSEILPDTVNTYCDGFRHQAVERVNGVKINSIKDLKQAFESSSADFIEVRFIGNESPMILDAKAAKENHPKILEKYQVITKQ